MSITVGSRFGSVWSFFFSRGTALSKKLQLQIFFPSWKFFETEGPTLDFCFRTSFDAIEFAEWQYKKPHIQKLRSLKTLFFNPNENYYLATCSLIEKLIIEINEIENNESIVENEIRKLVSYRLVTGLANAMVADTCKNNNVNIAMTQPPKYFQFKIRSFNYGNAETEPDRFSDIFISAIHEVNYVI